MWRLNIGLGILNLLFAIHNIVSDSHWFIFLLNTSACILCTLMGLQQYKNDE